VRQFVHSWCLAPELFQKGHSSSTACRGLLLGGITSSIRP
jgi:hypothetical protein